MTASATATRQSSMSAFADGVRGCRERELLGRGEVLEHVRGGRGRPRAAAAGGRPARVRARRGLGRRLDAQRDASSLVDERRIAAHDAARDPACRRPRAGRRTIQSVRPVRSANGGAPAPVGRRLRRRGRATLDDRGRARRACSDRRDRGRGRGRRAASCSAARSRSDADRAPALVDGAERDPQVRRHALEVEVGRRDRLVRDALDARRERVARGVVGGQAVVRLRPLAGELLGELRRPVGGGHDVAADRLGQRPQQPGDELVAHAGHLPVEAVRAQLREQRQRHDRRHAVVGGSRLEAVGEREHLVALAPARREVALVAARAPRRRGRPRSCRAAAACGSRHPATTPRTSARRTRPAGSARRRTRKTASSPTRMSRRRSRSSIFSSRRRSSRLRRSNAVRRLSRCGGVPLALDERVAQEQLARERPVEAGELHAAPRDDLDAEEGHLLVGGCRARRLRPVRLAQLTLGEVARERLGPRRVDRGDRAREQAGGLDELGRHDRGGALLLAGPSRGRSRSARRARRGSRRGGSGRLVRHRRGAPSRGGAARALVEDADVREQPGEDRLVDRRRGRPSASVARRGAERRRCALQLPVHVDPLPHAHVVEVLGAAQPPEGARPERGLLLLQVVPEVQQAEEVARRVGEARVQAVGLLAALLGPLAHVLDRHARRRSRSTSAQHAGALAPR